MLGAFNILVLIIDLLAEFCVGVFYSLNTNY